MTKCPSLSSRTACLISSLLSNYSYVDYNKRFISFATNEKVDALSRLLTISIAQQSGVPSCRFSSDDCKLILKIPIWNKLINVLYCILLYSCQQRYNHEFREETIRKQVHRDLVPIQFAGIKLNKLLLRKAQDMDVIILFDFLDRPRSSHLY